MIIRARPKYLTPAMFDVVDNESIASTDEVFYNSGRSALKHFLIEWKNFNKIQQPAVAMQAFNCRVVADSALQAGYRILLMDTKMSDLSIGLNQLTVLPHKPDVLLLTHCQGIPCTEYREVAEYCITNSILLIDDLAQTEGSKINDVETGSLSNAWIKSYAFDKPFNAWEGGSLRINSIPAEGFQDYFRDSYMNLETESELKAGHDLKMLKTFLALTEKDIYFRGMQFGEVVKDLLAMGESGRTAAKLYSRLIKIGRKVLNKISGEKNQISIRKMHSGKVKLVAAQRRNFTPDEKEVNALEEFISAEGGDILSIPGASINWNRYTVIDKTGELRGKFNNNEIEVSNYNWPLPLNRIFRKNSNVIVSENLEVSEYLSANILNIPVWSNYFQSRR